MSEILGAIKVPTMILTATLCTLGSLIICRLTTSVQNPTIMQSAMQYPYTIIFRVGQMYSLFIIFLELLFIKWWLDSFPVVFKTKLMVKLGTVGLLAYGLFVCCIDRKRINYNIAQTAVFISAITITAAIAIIMLNLKKNRDQGIALADDNSWLLKKIFSTLQFAGFALGVLIYIGEVDIHNKPIVQYLTVISTSLFFWSFSLDFRKFSMDVEEIFNPTPNNNMQQQPMLS